MTHVKTDWQQVGLRLKRELAARGMEPAELARAAGVSRYTPYKWMGGGKMESHHLEKVAYILGMHPAVLRYGASSISIPDYSAAASIAYKACEERYPHAPVEAKTALATQVYQLKMDLGVTIDDGRLLEYARTLVDNLLLQVKTRP